MMWLHFWLYLYIYRRRLYDFSGLIYLAAALGQLAQADPYCGDCEVYEGMRF